MELLPAVQNYDWGKPFDTSIVAKFYKQLNPDLNKSVPYAELWMGTHPNGPSKLAKTDKPLSEVIKNHPEYLGSKSVETFGNDLPFLFKVLSVHKALSIQAHPSKKHAEELHKLRPDLYKDPNHKPELAIALTKFQALCGFRPINHIEHYLRHVPELVEVIGADLVKKLYNADEEKKLEPLKKCFQALMTCDEKKVEIQLQALLLRFSKLEPDSNIQLVRLIQQLAMQFPNDVGCFVPYFMNDIELKPGEAIYLGPNEPHAYLSGDCVECMACSDNVVRAGLTPKFKDVETLCKMLIYEGASPGTKYFQSTKENDFTRIFSPPVPDFAVAEIKIKITKTPVDLIVRNSASIIICIKGKGEFGDIKFETGRVVFVPAMEKVQITKIVEELLLYQATTNV